MVLRRGEANDNCSQWGKLRRDRGTRKYSSDIVRRLPIRDLFDGFRQRFVLPAGLRVNDPDGFLLN
jgi:hypothetical protein